MFVLLAIAVLGLMAAASLCRGPRAGLWCGWTVALFLLPTWCVVKVGAATVDLRTVAAVGGLGCVCLARGGPPVRGVRWVATDALVVALVLVLIASEAGEGDFGTFTTAEVVRVWLLPYVVGRSFLGSADDVPRVLSVTTPAIAALAAYSVAEAVSGVNVVSQAAGVVSEVLERGAGFRWGLRRAQGFTEHPIYLGYLLALALPWAAAARRAARAGRAPRWWGWVPALAASAVVGTGSRGAMAAAAVAWVAPTLFTWSPRRLLALGAVAVAGAVVIVERDSLVADLTRLAGETPEAAATLDVGGRVVEYNGTAHRFLIFEVYDEAIARLDPLGYGGRLGGVDTTAIPSVFHSIDNHYLLFLLQRGHVGFGCFVLFAAAALVGLWRAAAAAEPPAAGLARGLFGAAAAVTVLLASVWWSPDFGAAWLFSAGLAGSLGRVPAAAPPPDADAAPLPRPRFVAAHAPVRFPHHEVLR